MTPDLTKKDLYEAVKSLIECEHPHIHLNQHKLFTLFSIAFQYFLFSSTKKPGAYIIRIEDSGLADKLAKKAKDPSTRKFMHSLMVPRKLKCDKSFFYLDYFHLGSWNFTNEIPKEKIQGALIVKNTSSRPMDDTLDVENENEDGVQVLGMKDLPKNYFLTTLQEKSPKTIIIAFENEFENVHPLSFPFIKKKEERTMAGVTIADDFDLDSINTR